MADIEKTPVYQSEGQLNAPAITQRSVQEGMRNNASVVYEDEKFNSGNNGTVNPVPIDAEAVTPQNETEKECGPSFYDKYRPFILGALACIILGWWISSIIVHEARHRWVRP